jgi:seryl-tRNA synthetase
MNKDQMAKTAQLDQFDEELYKVRTCLFSRTSFIDDLIGT